MFSRKFLMCISNIIFLIVVHLDAIQAKAKDEVGTEPKDIYFFREGTVVMWNVNDMESSNVLALLRNYEENSYTKEIVQAEREIVLYTYSENG